MKSYCRPNPNAGRVQTWTLRPCHYTGLDVPSVAGAIDRWLELETQKAAFDSWESHRVLLPFCKNVMQIGPWWHDDVIQTEFALEAQQWGNAIKPFAKRRPHSWADVTSMTNHAAWASNQVESFTLDRKLLEKLSWPKTSSFPKDCTVEDAKIQWSLAPKCWS